MIDEFQHFIKMLHMTTVGIDRKVYGPFICVQIHEISGTLTQYHMLVVDFKTIEIMGQ